MPRPARLLAVAALALAGCQSARAPEADRVESSASSPMRDGLAPRSVTLERPLLSGPVRAYLYDQADQLDAIPGAEVSRRDDSILLQFPSSLLFKSGSSDLGPGAGERLRRLADTLVEYPASRVIIKGHTDAVGEPDYNMRLSAERSERVRDYLVEASVGLTRISAIGFGETLPVASNTTAAGRQQNRRVEIEIRPDDEVMRARADSGS